MSRGHSGELVTVAELIEALRKCPPDALVWAEGTEAPGEVTGVEVDTDGVTLTTTAFHAALWSPR